MALPRVVLGPGGGLAEQRLELGKELLDRVQIRAVGRQVEERCTRRGDGPTDAVAPMRGKVVEHHDIAGSSAGARNCST
jgi:hypothetical protein